MFLLALILSACGGGKNDPISQIAAPPPAVILVAVSAGGSSTLDVNWLPGSDASGVPASADIVYQVHVSEEDKFTPSISTLRKELRGEYAARIVGLTAGKHYAVQIVAVDPSGARGISAEMGATTSIVNSELKQKVSVVTLASDDIVSVGVNSVTLGSNAAKVKTGQFIGSAAGEGLLRQVTAVQADGARQILTTRQAALNEVIEQMTLSTSFLLTETTAAAAQSLATPNRDELQWPGGTLRMTAPPQALQLVANTAPRKLLFKGDFTVENAVGVSFEPAMAVETELALGRLKTANFDLTGRIEIGQSVTVTATGAGEIDAVLPLLAPRTYTKVSLVGTLPVVTVVELSADMRVEGTTSGQITATEELKFSIDDLRAGLSYQNGGWTTTRHAVPAYNFRVAGTGDTEVNLKISVIPKVSVKFQGLATGYIVVRPSMRSQFGIHGQISFEAAALGSNADQDSWLSKGLLQGEVDAFVMADVSVLDFNIARWPGGAVIADFNTYQPLSLLPTTTVAGLPTLTAEVSSDTHPDNSRAVLIKGRAFNIPNPFGGVAPMISFDHWTAPKVVGPDQNFRVVPSPAGSNAGDVWIEFFNPGSHRVRLGGLSTLGSWSRQIAEVTVNTTNPTVTGISPSVAPVDKETVFSVTGSKLPPNLDFALSGCEGVHQLAGGTENVRQFACRPGLLGLQTVYVRLAPGQSLINDPTQSVVNVIDDTRFVLIDSATCERSIEPASVYYPTPIPRFDLTLVGHANAALNDRVRLLHTNRYSVTHWSVDIPAGWSVNCSSDWQSSSQLFGCERTGSNTTVNFTLRYAMIERSEPRAIPEEAWACLVTPANEEICAKVPSNCH